MPSITVSEHVVARIRALKRAGETSADQTLRRILDAASPDRKTILTAYEKAEQDIQSTN